MARRSKTRSRRFSGLQLSRGQKRVAVFGVAGVGALALAWWALVPSEEPRGAALLTLPSTKADFIAQMYPAIDQAAPSLSVRTKFMILAHAAYESGWGHATAYKGGWNPFNITSGSSWSGAVVEGPDTEYGKPITQRFRAYPSPAAAVADYLSFLGASRYANAYHALLAGDTSFVSLLGQDGYYTLDPATYQSAYLGVLKSVVTAAQGMIGVPDDSAALTS